MTQYRLPVEKIAYRTVKDQTIVVQLERNEIHVANVSASVLLQGLTNGRTQTELVDLLLETFEVDRPEAEKAVSDFLMTAIDRGLIEAQETE